MHRITKIAAAAAVGVLVWFAFQGWTPRRKDLRDFDAVQVARLETDMWRAYYEHHPVRLFTLLGRLLREQYGMGLGRSWTGAYYAAHAAVTFQRGAKRADYELALPDLREYYGMIARDSDPSFSVDVAATNELEWWIAHRERRRDLVHWLAELQSGIYRIPADRVQRHAELRAQAMLYRDERGTAISEADWEKIDGWLRESWGSLREAVR